MVTVTPNDKCFLFYGLSSETKPITPYIGNGSEFIEQNTGKVFLFDEENQKWLEFTNTTILFLLRRLV